MMALQIPASLNEIKLSETCPLQIIDKKNNDLNIISTPQLESVKTRMFTGVFTKKY